MEPKGLEEFDEVARLHFAVVGLQTREDTLHLSETIQLRRLRSFPTEEELVRSLRSLPVAGIMAEFGEELVQHELVLDAEYINDVGTCLSMANAILTAVRIATGAELLCPAFCERSWAGLHGITDNSCRASRLEQALHSHEFDSPALVTEQDIEWVRNSFETLNSLIEEKANFRKAIEAFCSYFHAANYFMMTAQLWAGLEALFGLRFEVSYRLAVQVACFLEGKGSTCRDCYQRMRELYKVRSNAIHGTKVNEEQLREHVREVRLVFSRLLRRIIDNKKIPNDTDFEDLLFLESENRTDPDDEG